MEVTVLTKRSDALICFLDCIVSKLSTGVQLPCLMEPDATPVLTGRKRMYFSYPIQSYVSPCMKLLGENALTSLAVDLLRSAWSD